MFEELNVGGKEAQEHCMLLEREVSGQAKMRGSLGNFHFEHQIQTMKNWGVLPTLDCKWKSMGQTSAFEKPHSLALALGLWPIIEQISDKY